MCTALILAAIVGCQHRDSLVPVEGTVTLDGKPLANATVLLSPIRGNGPGPFMSTANADGRFSLGPVGKEGTGAAPDSYMLIVTTAKPDPSSSDGALLPGQKEVVPIKYRDGSERFVVPEGGNKSAAFQLKTR